MYSVTAFKNLHGRGNTSTNGLAQVQGLNTKDIAAQIQGLNTKDIKVEGADVAPSIPVQGVNHGPIKVAGLER